MLWPSKDFECVGGFLVLKCMAKLIYVATYEVIVKVYLQSKINQILNSFAYFFQTPYVCIFLRLKSLPFLSGTAAPLAPHLTQTLVLQSFFPFQSMITWKLQWLRPASLKQMFNYAQEQSNQKKKSWNNNS